MQPRYTGLYNCSLWTYIDNPTYEFYPPKNINGFNGTQIPSQFMVDTLNGNFFPHIFTLPDGRLFIAANRGAMLFDWKTNTETRLSDFPNGVRVTYAPSTLVA